MVLHPSTAAMPAQPPPMTDPRTGNRLYKLRARMTWDSVDWRSTYGTTGA